MIMNTFCLCVVTFSYYLHCAVSLEAVGCYGNTADDFIIPRCDSEKVISIDNLYAVAKKASMNCPQEFTVSDVARRQLCCSRNPEDCVMPYTGVSDYHTICIGASTCTKRVAWQLTTCSETGYQPRSNYMLMSYQCVSKSDIISVPSDASKSGKTVTIQNPTSGIDPNTDTTCSVTASCNSSIAVTSLYQDFVQDASGVCTQHVDILDGNTANRSRIDCAQNTNYSSGILYTSRAHFITVNLRSNLPTKGGRLWMQFHATHYEASIVVHCGTSTLTAAPNVSTCPETTTTRIVTSPSRKPRRGKDDDDDSGGLSRGAAVGLTIGIVLLVLLLLILLCVFCKKKLKKNEMKVAHKVDDIPDSEFAEALGITGTYISSRAPVTSLVHTMPRRLTPIGAPDEEHKRTRWNTLTWMPPTMSVVKSMASTGGKTDENRSTQPDSTKTSVFEISREMMAQNGKAFSHDISHNITKWKKASGVH
ncbi:uncharacterized protein [Haliotis asinina]|uniref:uncharacterized protein n=1 Tax=Haliotis asinina TaxID=109174 RepID=UPI003531A8B4